jgi:hypothetical protein
MASHLDLEEQEQLDQLKHFWNHLRQPDHLGADRRFGAFAAWNGWQYWQRTQGAQASALYDEIERAVQAGDLERAEQGFADIKDKFGRHHLRAAGRRCWLAKVLVDKGKPDMRQGRAGLGGRAGLRRGLPGHRAAAAGRPLLVEPSRTTKRSSSSRRHAQGIRSRSWPTAAATSTTARQEATRPRPSTPRPTRPGRPVRVPPPGRSEAHRAGRRREVAATGDAGAGKRQVMTKTPKRMPRARWPPGCASLLAGCSAAR